MRPALPDAAAEFRAAADKAAVAAGGTDLARRAEKDPAVREVEMAGLLAGLGVADLDPRTDLETAAAAGELCRVGGRHALPYPLAGYLLRGGANLPLALVGGDPPLVDHGDLFPVWRLVRVGAAAVAGSRAEARLASKLGPFVTPMTAGGDATTADPMEVALELTFHAWRVLGAVERSVELAVEHVTGRRQFGRPLAAFQAVQFQLADAAVARDGLRELCRFTLWRLFADPAGQMVDALALRLQACDAARTVLRTAQQLFGASGLCDEYDISVLCRHVQPDLRLPFGAERTASELFSAVARDGFAGLFPQGGGR